MNVKMAVFASHSGSSHVSDSIIKAPQLFVLIPRVIEYYIMA